MEKEDEINGGVPKETETIAARRAARIARNLIKARKDLVITKAWWSNNVIESIGIIIIFALNFLVVYKYFGKEAPHTTFSGPVIPALAQIINLTGINVSYSIQIVHIVFYILFPISLYIFIRKVSERKLVAVLSVLLSSVPVYPLASVRLGMMFFSEEGPHASSLAVIPLATYGILSFVREGGVRNLILASVFSAFVALISPFGFMTFCIFATITTFSEVMLGKGRLKVIRFIVAVIFAATLCSFWYNPPFFYWMVIGPMGEDIRRMITKLVPISFFTLPVLGTFGYLLFDRKPNLQPVFLASFFTIAFGIIIITGGGFFPSNPSRYASELGIAISMLFGVFSVSLLDFVKFRKKEVIQSINNKALSSYVLVFVTVILMASIVVGSRLEIVSVGTHKSLSDVERGEIWVERDRLGGMLYYSGFVITTLGLISLGGLYMKSKTKTENNDV